MLTYDPDDVARLELTRGDIAGKAFLTFFETNDHTTVKVSDATLYEALANKGAVLTDNELAELHLSVLPVVVLTEHFLFEGFAEGGELLVGTDDLEHIIGEDDIVAIRDVDTHATSHNAADMDTVLAAKVELLQRRTHPHGVKGHLEISDVDIAV